MAHFSTSLPMGSSRDQSEMTVLNMEADIKIQGKKAPRGERMTLGKGWKLAFVKGQKRVFAARLLSSHNIGKLRIALFSVPK